MKNIILLAKLNYYTMKNIVSFRLMWLRYHIPHMLFKWTVDDEGDICFRLFFLFHFIKYKEHTIIKVGFYDMEPAPKYLGS